MRTPEAKLRLLAAADVLDADQHRAGALDLAEHRRVRQQREADSAGFHYGGKRHHARIPFAMVGSTAIIIDSRGAQPFWVSTYFGLYTRSRTNLPETY